jgi:hypothetical protein
MRYNTGYIMCTNKQVIRGKEWQFVSNVFNYIKIELLKET